MVRHHVPHELTAPITEVRKGVAAFCLVTPEVTAPSVEILKDVTTSHRVHPEVTTSITEATSRAAFFPPCMDHLYSVDHLFHLISEFGTT